WLTASAAERAKTTPRPKGSEESKQKVDLKSNAQGTAQAPSYQEHVMSFVRIEQRNARLAADVKLSQVRGSEGLISKGTVVVISNGHRGQGREDEVTSIQWTLWGKQAENAARYLAKGSHVNVVGRLQ